MATGIPPELATLGESLLAARTLQNFTQKELEEKSGVNQARISRIEQGFILPTLPQLLHLARALGVPVQWFLNSSTVPGKELTDIALELQRLGVVDLLVPNAIIPGAFRPTEQVLALAVSGNQPDPRIIEAIPAVLAWNPWSHTVLRAYSQQSDPRAGIRLAWLADIVLTARRNEGFPGGCNQLQELEAYVRRWSRIELPSTEDDLGRPAPGDDLHPVWKRWKIRYAGTLASFVDRAKILHAHRERRPFLPWFLPKSSNG